MNKFNSVGTAVLLFLLLLSGAVFAQNGVDSIMVTNIKVWYPGGSEAGKIKAELWWHHPDYPVSLLTSWFGVHFGWGQPGNIVCDSVRGIQMSAPYSVQYDVTIDNTLGRMEANFTASDNPDIYFAAGSYHLADMYFTVNSAGTFSTAGWGNPYFFCFPDPDCVWYGREYPTANIIADPGDFNGDGLVNVSDCVVGIGYIFGILDGPAPNADANGDCITNISDVVYLLNYIFAGGPAPAAGCQFWR